MSFAVGRIMHGRLGVPGQIGSETFVTAEHRTQQEIVRIHRSTIVNIAAVTHIVGDNGQLLLRTRSGAELTG